jgi:hypothetical protein
MRKVYTMVSNIPAHVNRRFQSFERSVATTEEKFDRLESTGTFRASDLYYEKSLTVALLEKLPADQRQNRDIIAEYDRVTIKLVTLEQKLGIRLRDKLADELRYYLDSYHAGVCCMQLKIMDPDAVSDLAPRDIIRILLAKLHSDFDLGDIEETLATLDDAYQSMKEKEEGVTGKESVSSCPESESTICRCFEKEKIPEV